MRRLVFLGALGATASAAAALAARTYWQTWGIDPADAAAALPGDDIIADAAANDTRSITIEAPPSAVWPWLVQMGYGRAGWYSYDALDMKGKSARAIVPEWQQLAVGDVVMTHPQGGFEVKVLEPGRALVLYVDTALVAAQAARLADEATPAGLKASGAFLEKASAPEFAASWTFVLEPVAGGRTRLVERVRAEFGEPTLSSRIGGPLLGFGVFVMMRRQMLGIRERAEMLDLEPPQAVASESAGPAEPATA